MNELEKYSLMPPQLGPPLPGILKAYWPWVRVPPPEVPKPRAVETPRTPLMNYMDVENPLLKASTENFRAEQKAKGLVPFYYE